MDQAVNYSLSELREKATPGSSRMSVNRATARILNSFEENRIQSKPFIGVQEANSMQLYASSWSKLIRFLLGLLANPDACRILTAKYLNVQPKIDHSLREVKRLAETLHAVNKLELSFVECLNVFEVESESDLSDDNSPSTQPLRLHAQTFIQAIDSLSIALVRYHWQNSSFDSPVVGFAALHTLNEEGTWILARNLSSRLSGWIHCMQLWLLCYCLRKKERSEFENEKLQDIVRAECQHYLVNTCSSPVAELSFWRLLTWTASNDTVRHPVTTMNDDCTQVSHATITMNIEEWRAGIHSMIDTATELLKEELLLGLDAPHYSIAMLIDSPTDLRPGQSFSNQSFRPRQSQINEYLLTVQRFLRLISVLIYWTSGLPPRRKELLGLAWCNHETARNLYISHGMMVFITG